MMKAVLSNADHPEYGVVTIPLPVPRNQYDHCVALLEALEIGDASEADCRLDSLDSAWPVLNQLVCTKVNLDELDYVSDAKCIIGPQNRVRRLTPLECERLQGFPDRWTDIPGASDTARYKALGNSVAVPCVETVLAAVQNYLRWEEKD